MARKVLGGQENLARRLRVSLAGVNDRSNWRLDLPPTVG
jgi:DNA-binding transcriptional regulator YdaS (Cro superfamily)